MLLSCRSGGFQVPRPVPGRHEQARAGECDPISGYPGAQENGRRDFPGEGWAALWKVVVVGGGRSGCHPELPR